MDLEQVLRNEQLQLAILEDAVAEFSELEGCCSDLIGDSGKFDDGGADKLDDPARPISMVALMAQCPTTDSGEQSSLEDFRAVAGAGVPWWERTWMILTIIFVSPTFRAALQDGSAPQQEWLAGSETTPSFQERFEGYICGSAGGKFAATPLEAVTDEITLWEYLNS